MLVLDPVADRVVVLLNSTQQRCSATRGRQAIEEILLFSVVHG
jgi:hypothetical protein